MKLSYKYTLAYALITLVVLAIGFTIVYAAIQRNARQSLTARLEHLNDVVAAQIEAGTYEGVQSFRQRIAVQPIPRPDSPFEATVVELRKEWDGGLRAAMPSLQVSSQRAIHGQWYRISSVAFLPEPDDIYLNGIILVFAWTFVFLIALVVVLSEIFSWHILRPFNSTLEAMQQFHVDQNAGVILDETSTDEFRQLNAFLLTMTDKAQRDYTSLREFTENASHELQTPIATMTAKIELLMQTELDEEQLGMIAAIHDESQRLTRINQSLILLARLDQYQLPDDATVNFSDELRNSLQRFSDWLEMKSIRLSVDIRPNVMLDCDPSLAEMLLTNLISNAIRHNVVEGELELRLDAHALVIRNTGAAPTIPVEQLFGRFRKGNAAIDSIGIGLAIVRKICLLHRYGLRYEFDGGYHEITVTFNDVG